MHLSILGGLRPVLDELFMGVLAINRDEKICYYNKFMSTLDENKLEEVMGYKISEVYSVKDSDSPTVESIRTGIPVFGRYMHYKTARGRQLATLNYTYPLHSSGELVGAICMCLEFTSLFSYVTLNNGAPTPAAAPVRNEDKVEFKDIIGKNPVFREAVEVAKIAATGPSPVMLVGETGTGKDLFAQAIHNYSPRAKARFVPINCSAIPEPLLEGLLFGTTKGAFTGAVDKSGLFEYASGGTIFLDEVQSMPLTLQAKLLRVIQNKKVRKVGSLVENNVDVKLISAVCGHPRQLIEEKRLRDDLYYRLGVIQVGIPPLRERPEDIHELAQHFTEKIALRLGRKILGINADVIHNLKKRTWPGNVRELEHVLESSINFVSDGEYLEVRHLKRSGRHLQSVPSLQTAKNEQQDIDSRSQIIPTGYSLKNDLINYEKQMIISAIKANNANISKSAMSLGISQQLLVYKIKKYNINKFIYANN
jgi:arginine utilization regulatory protein